MAAHLAKPPKGSILNRADRLAHGVVAAWLFNENAGVTAYDSAGQRWHGAIASGTTWGAGRYGKWLSGTTSTHLATVTGNPLKGASAFSLAAVLFSTNVGFNSANIFNCNDSGGTGDGFVLSLDGAASAKVSFMKRVGFTGSNILSDAALSSNTLYRIVATVSRSGVCKLFVDGIQQSATTTTTGTINNTTNATIAQAGSSRAAAFDAMVMWKRELTSAEVRAWTADPFRMFRRRNMGLLKTSGGGGGGAVGPLIGAGRIMGGSLNAGRLVRN